MGGTYEYWDRVGLDFLRSKGATITLLNVADAELTAQSRDEDVFTRAVGDACEMSQFQDQQFDLAHSNSVLEHVGTWDRMKAFGAETSRVGRSYYVQTPNFWFPVDPHFYRAPMFHWLPRSLRARLLTTFPIAYVGRIGAMEEALDIVDDVRLIGARQFRALFPDANIVYERILGLNKSLIAIRRPGSK
jgi:hypothetical protein